jgi:putative transcriptional regulator
MYHYRECGLRNVYLANGYREVATPYGRGIAVEDVHGLHNAIARELVNTKPALSGAEVRFIRKFLELTQTHLADLLGVEEQSVRRWEGLEELPRQADRSVRLVFRDMLRDLELPLDEFVQRIAEAHVPARYEYRHRAKGWQSGRMAACVTEPTGSTSRAPSVARAKPKALEFGLTNAQRRDLGPRHGRQAPRQTDDQRLSDQIERVREDIRYVNAQIEQIAGRAVSDPLPAKARRGRPKGTAALRRELNTLQQLRSYRHAKLVILRGEKLFPDELQPLVAAGIIVAPSEPKPPTRGRPAKSLIGPALRFWTDLARAYYEKLGKKITTREAVAIAEAIIRQRHKRTFVGREEDYHAEVRRSKKT